MGNIYRKKKKTGRYIFLFLIVFAAITYSVFRWQQKVDLFDADAVLQNTVLKNKKFSGKVSVIENDGLKAFLMEEKSNPIVSVSFKFLHAGTAYETDDQSGLVHLLSEMLLAGTKNHDFLKFRYLTEEYGIKIGYSASDDDFDGYLIFPKVNMQMAENLLVETLTEPQFDENYMMLYKQQLAHLIDTQEENIEKVSELTFRKSICKGHPYARNPLGDKSIIAKLDEETLRNFMQRYFTKSNLLIGIAGDITSSEAEHLIARLFGHLPQQGDNRILRSIVVEANGKSYQNEKKFAQVLTRFVVQGTHRQADDFYPLYIANYIFGGSGLNSVISKNIREDKGLTYGIYTYLRISDAANLLEGHFSSSPENFKPAKELLLEEWHKFAAKGITQTDLQQAKKSLIDSYNLRFSSISDISEMLVGMQKYNLGVDFLQKRNQYVDNVTLGAVNDAIKKYYTSEPDFITVGTYKGD